MRSIKPGRGPSLMGGVGSIAAALFGIIWVAAVSSMGAPPFFALFGVVFILLAVGGAVYNLYNAGARNRMSIVDITSGEEESDPIADALSLAPRRFPGEFCPFCGEKVNADHNYCPKCGKDI